ncbi:FAD-dependent oxidoreductase [Cellulomonas sp. P5_E12]
MAAREVLVVGAGIGGLALAAGLSGDVRVTVLEQAAGLRETGGALTLFPNGVAALASFGIDVAGTGAPVSVMRMHRHDGTRLMTIDFNEMARRTGYPVRNILRRDLLRLLAAHVPAGAVELDTGVTGVAATEVSATAVLSDGTSREADLVVGADGTSSVVRRSVVSARPARTSGWMTVQSLITGALPEVVTDRSGASFVGRAGFCGIMPVSPDVTMVWCDVRVPPDGWRTVDAEWLREMFGGYAHPVRDILERIETLDHFEHRTHEVLDWWGRGPTTLLGDAAHAVPPTAGQGANQALDDAWTLREALRGDEDVVRAVRRYENHRVPRVRRMSQVAAAERPNQAPGRAAAFVMRHVPARAAGIGHTALVRRWSSVLSGSLP